MYCQKISIGLATDNKAFQNLTSNYLNNLRRKRKDRRTQQATTSCKQLVVYLGSALPLLLVAAALSVPTYTFPCFSHHIKVKVISEKEKKERYNTANKNLMADNCGLLSENLWFVNYLWSSVAVSSEILSSFYVSFLK